LTTTKQIETRVKRQVKFEDGKVIEDTGPIVSTASKRLHCYLGERRFHFAFFFAATEDTDKVESEQTEVSGLEWILFVLPVLRQTFKRGKRIH